MECSSIPSLFLSLLLLSMESIEEALPLNQLLLLLFRAGDRRRKFHRYRRERVTSSTTTSISFYMRQTGADTCEYDEAAGVHKRASKLCKYIEAGRMMMMMKK